MDEGLVSGEGFAIDASIIKADANRVAVYREPNGCRKEAGPSRAVREYLEALEETNPEEETTTSAEATGRQERLADRSRGALDRCPGGPAFYAYSTNYLIDLDAGIIVDVEATPAHRNAGGRITKTMIDRVEQRFGIKPDRLIGDTAYGTAPMLAWMVEEKDIEPHVPVWDKTERKNGQLSSNDFSWNEQANEYRCPAGNPLRSEWRAFKNERSTSPKPTPSSSDPDRPTARHVR